MVMNGYIVLMKFGSSGRTSEAGHLWLGMVEHLFNPSIWGAEARVRGLPGLQELVPGDNEGCYYLKKQTISMKGEKN